MWLKKIFEKMHVCIFSKPIISKYSTFNSRDIIYECRCGNKKDIKVYRGFGSDFPIKTTNFISDEEFLEILSQCNEKTS